MRYVSKHSGRYMGLFLFLFCCVLFCFVFSSYFSQTKKLKFCLLGFAGKAKQRIIKTRGCKISCFTLLCYAIHYVLKHSGQNFIFFGFLYFVMLCYVSKHSSQNLIFLCFSLYFAVLCYVSKHSGQNFIFFVFLYFAMLCAMFQNIAGDIYCFLHISQTKKLRFCLLCF